MMKKNGYSDDDINTIINTALELEKYGAVFYTGHCTGLEPYEAMKKLMDDQLRYVHSGDEIMIPADGSLWEPRKPAKAEPGPTSEPESETAAIPKPETAVKPELKLELTAEPAPETPMKPVVEPAPETAAEPAPETAAEAEPGPSVKTATKTVTRKETKKASKTASSGTRTKSQKILAGAAAALFVITMVTGLKRK